MTQTDGSTESINYGYQVLVDGQAIITLRSRHAAIGLTCVFRRNYDGETTVSVDPVPHTGTKDLPGLKDEPAKADS